MDTRSKILTLDQALALRAPLVIASGSFDLLRAGHARELARLRTGTRKLLVVVLPSALRLLPASARVEMAAALRVVDYVVTTDVQGLERLSRVHAGTEVFSLDADDSRWIRQLIVHVRRR